MWKQGIVRQTGALPRSGRCVNNNEHLAHTTATFFLGEGNVKSNKHDTDSHLLKSSQSEYDRMLRDIPRGMSSRCCEENGKPVKGFLKILGGEGGLNNLKTKNKFFFGGGR